MSNHTHIPTWWKTTPIYKNLCFPIIIVKSQNDNIQIFFFQRSVIYLPLSQNTCNLLLNLRVLPSLLHGAAVLWKFHLGYLIPTIGQVVLVSRKCPLPPLGTLTCSQADLDLHIFSTMLRVSLILFLLAYYNGHARKPWLSLNSISGLK